jgi:hypothetical protein
MWVPVFGVLSGLRLVDEHGIELDPAAVDQGDVVQDVLRVGSRHRYTFRVFGMFGLDESWWVQRVAESIEILDEMPPEGLRARSAHDTGGTDGHSPSSDGVES